jgi:hypothetical protein
MRVIHCELNRADHLPGYASSGYVEGPVTVVIGCISRSGVHRADHDFDRDAVCFWCDDTKDKRTGKNGEDFD